MATVQFKDDNRTQAIAKGFDDMRSAASAVETFLAEKGDEYGFEANGCQEEDEQGAQVFYFRVTDNS